MTLLIWTSRAQRAIGGLQTQVSRLAAQMEALSDLQAIVIQAQLSAEDADVTRSRPEYLRSRAVVENLVDGAQALYCARLFDGFERCQIAALFQMAQRVPVLIRCPTTDDARRLRRVVDCLGTEVGSARLFAHCLNSKSVRLFAGAANVAGVLQPNTARPAVDAKLDPASLPEVPRYFYCGRGAKSKNVEALAKAWDCAAERELLELYGPRDLERLASGSCRRRFAGCYQGEPPFRFGDVVFLPSFREGHPNVLVEAFKVGAVLVGTDIPGIREHIEGGRGILVRRPFDVSSLVGAIRSALRLIPEHRMAIGVPCRAYFERHFSSPVSSAALVVARVLGLDLKLSSRGDGCR